MDGCFCVYVVNTTDALLLFFKQRNLETGNIPVSGCTQAQEEEPGPPRPAHQRCLPGPSQQGVGVDSVGTGSRGLTGKGSRATRSGS